ncbi:hypothetical protein V5799_020241 [Amblyomma americanum]|uniref:Uncharacterized protein n=1 Tax=Amblyomma americanum TaxID=6943 RepID=A0AAQ4EUE7_AMBAM
MSRVQMSAVHAVSNIKRVDWRASSTVLSLRPVASLPVTRKSGKWCTATVSDHETNLEFRNNWPRGLNVSGSFRINTE